LTLMTCNIIEELIKALILCFSFHDTGTIYYNQWFKYYVFNGIKIVYYNLVI